MPTNEEVTLAKDFYERWNEKCYKSDPNYYNEVLFWASVGVLVILSMVAIIGNGTVIVIGCRKRKTGGLKNLNNAVRSLAVTDLLIGVVGMPALILFSYWG